MWKCGRNGLDVCLTRLNYDMANWLDGGISISCAATNPFMPPLLLSFIIGKCHDTWWLPLLLLFCFCKALLFNLEVI